MEYGTPPPDPTGGIGGFSSSVAHTKTSSGFTDGSIPEGSIDEALSVPSVTYNSLIMPPDIPGNFSKIPQSTELPQCVMSAEDQDTSQTDSGQESEEEGSNIGNPVGGDWLRSEEEEEDDDDDDLDATEDEEEEEEDGLIPNEDQLSNELEGWQSPNNETEEYEEIWGSESEEATNADRSSTESETETNETHPSKHGAGQNLGLSSNANSDKTLSPNSVLCFDEYGNLTTYRPEVPASPPMPPPAKVEIDKISNQDFLQAAETLESDMNESLNLQNRENMENGQSETQRLAIKPLKNRSYKHHESSEGCNVSDQELKQAFKQEVLTTATSRYGRARKRKTEDGFFFGTINFNELRKITSTVSPKKGKGVTGNSKSMSPEQKSKSSKDDSRAKTRLDEALESVILNGPMNHASEAGMDRDMLGDVDSIRNELEPNTAKSDIDKVQNSISNETDTFSTDNYFGQTENESYRRSSPKEEKVLVKNDVKPHKGRGRHKKEVKNEAVVIDKQEEIPVLPRTELKTTVDDDVEMIKQAEFQKRLSLPKRSELSRLRENEPAVVFTSERMLRRRSDVDRIKNALLANKPVQSRRRAARNNAQLELENKETAENKSHPSITQPSSVSYDENVTKVNQNEQNSDTVKSPKSRRRKLDHDVPGRIRRRLRSSVDSAMPSQTIDVLSEGRNSAVADVLKTPGTQAPVVSASELQDSGTNQSQNPVTDVSYPKNKRDRLAQRKSAPASTEEDELGAMTKSGRLVRKPQLMDVSAEAKKQKMEQLKNKELLAPSAVEQEMALPALDYKSMEKEHPCEHMVGDIVWVQLKGNPLWPAMVSYNPESGEFTKLSVKHSWLGRASCQRLYFVQFFSDNSQTYWITPNSVLPFEGYEKLKEYLQSLKKKMKFLKSYQKIHSKGLLNTLLHIKKLAKGMAGGQKGERWMSAIDEAERAMALDRYERLQKFALGNKKDKKDVASQEKVETKKSLLRRNNNVGRKNKIGRPRKDSLKNKVLLGVSKSSDDGVSTDAEFSGFDENYSSDENRNVSNLISDISSGNKESFAQYAAKHLQKFILENPNISETAARTKLRWRWKKLAKSQAAKRKLKGEMKNERKSRNLEQGTLKRKHSNSVERDDVEDLDVTTYKRKRLDDSKDNQKGVYKVVRNEKVCYICESASTQSGADMIRCKGLCCGIFHLSCVGLSSVPKQDFKCVECQTGEHQCFCCKSSVGSRQRCTVPFCGKFYHEECIANWPQVSKNRHLEKFVCPRHICHMCAANADDMNDPVARNPPFTRCLRCPTTYHTGEECIAAGSEEISLNHHICTKHLKLAKNNLHHVNVSWCFCCSKGGSLLLCDQCPAAFHADCMKITAPEGSYVCEDCENGKFPVYGDVVWVKLGLYRWWPGQVLHPRFIPDNIENLPHQQGMFCVHFFGSNDYYWVTRGRAFHYQEGDKGSKAASSKTLEMQFQKAIEEALVAFRAHRARKAQLEAVRSGKGNLKPPPYVKIDSNRPVGNVRLNKLDLAAVNRCDCDPFSENPCGSDEKCLNRMLMFECVREVCGAGDRCGNQRFQKRQYANVASFRTEARGWGLKALDNIKKGDFVIEYVGELIDDEEFQRRIKEMHKVKEENYYFLTIDKDIMIDAGPKGNLARFMNHSCEPNCETQKWTVGGDTRVGLFASCDIPTGSELTFNYNLQCVGTEKKKCNCGSSNCSGFIGAKVQKNDSNGPKREKMGKRKRKRKRREAKISEDECYRCGGAGDLILCDVTDCPKSYHLQCLSLDKLPKGKWICPWHHCDECGQRSIRPNRCDYCPNSFCRQHVQGNLHHVPGVGNVCQDHDTEDIETLRGQMEAKVAAEITFSDRSYMDTIDESAIDEEKTISSSASHDIVPLYMNDASVDESSSCIYENTKQSVVSNSSQECDQIDTNAPVNASVIGPLRLRRNRRRPKKSDRVSEGHENNSSVINVNSDASVSQINSKTYPTKAVVPPRNGIRSTRNAPGNVSKVLHVL